MVMEEMKIYEKYEPDYLVAVTPYYYAVSQEVIIEHFKTIAHTSPIPLILYNIPQCTQNKVMLDTILELAMEENIAGVKDSSGDFISFSRGIYSCPVEGFSWIQGEDYLDGPSFTTGADGVVTGLGNVDIKPYIQMYRENKKGNDRNVNKMQQKINQLYEIIHTTGGKVIPSIKAGASLFKRSTKWMKIPDLTLSNENFEKVKELISELQYSFAS
jgi:4-hydroxy-tetrahydrodipicolinate synthase